MKLIKLLIILGVIFSSSGCNEELKLAEIPLGFWSPENALNTPEGLQNQNNYNYNRLFELFDGQLMKGMMYFGTDMYVSAREPLTGGFSDYKAQLTPSSGQQIEKLAKFWEKLYAIVFAANVVIGRSEEVEFESDEQKNRILAEALFFRGFAFKMLANLYGGAPLVLEETQSPRRDYVRATREETYSQSALDLEFAAQNLPDVSEIEANWEGKLTKAAARHALTEAYIALKEWDKAISTASSVIDNPNYAIMTSRFGKKANQEGDPFWDLFQLGNQNRVSGNKEGIFVMQVESDFPGTPNVRMERNFGPLYWYIRDPDGNNAFIGPTTQNGGRPGGFYAPTNYFKYTIWKSDWDNDYRNHERNLKRDWIVDNPESAYFGQPLSSWPHTTVTDTLRDFYPYIMKTTTPNDHPDIVIKNPDTGELVSWAGNTYSDWYIMRLAETYLLRAEAYLGKGDKQKAADDINVIRQRSNAKPVNPANVDIHYILDERARELAAEEIRRITLNRLGLLYDRVKIKGYNPFVSSTIEEYHNLPPIPYSEIERNTEAVLEQNPGYVN